MVKIISVFPASAALLLASQHVLAQFQIPSDLPAPCRDACEPIAKIFNDCDMTWKCICKTSTIASAQPCLACATPAGTTPRSVVDAFRGACADAGYPISASSGGVSIIGSARNSAALIIVAFAVTLLLA